MGKAVLLLFVSFGLTGCYMHSSISSLDPLPGPVFAKSTPFENVSGSINYATTPVSGYRVRHTAGLLTNKQSTSTPNGYKVYLHVSGHISSQEVNQ